MIIPVSMALIAIFLGYTVAVVCLLGATLGVAGAAPQFVEQEHLLRTDYKLAQAGVWLVCAALGGYVTAFVGDPSWALLEGLLLIAGLVTVMWKNTWEARQRGLPHQILLTALTIAGVVVGFLMRS